VIGQKGSSSDLSWEESAGSNPGLLVFLPEVSEGLSPKKGDAYESTL
jgi:hypothetical protein